MKFLSHLVAAVKGEPLVVGGAVVSAVAAAVVKAQPRTWAEWFAVCAPVVLGVLGRYHVFPIAAIRPLADQAAALTAQVAPAAGTEIRLIQSVIDSAASAEAVAARSGFPLPVAP
jgi:hypothetical protein